MQEIKDSLIQLEESVARLELVIHRLKKSSAQKAEQVADMKNVIRTTYEKIDIALTSYQKGEE